MCVTVTGKRVNRGVGFGLGIPADYVSYRNSRVTTSLKKALEKFDNSLDIKIEKCVK